jgi:hypothetical protein
MPFRTKTSKKSAFLAKINPNTPIKKFFVFVIVFALLGGGYFAYKSFAAVNGSIAFAQQLQPYGTARLVQERGGSKKNVTVWEISAGSSVGTTFNTGVNRAYKICAIFKLPRGGNISLAGGPAGMAAGGAETLNVPAGNTDYQKRCMSGGPTGASITASVGLVTGSDLRVSAISLEPF